MPTAVVTGANSGIGHEFARVLVESGYNVIATDKDTSGTIQSLSCEVVGLDVASPDSIREFKKHMADQPIDLLLNIAGVMSPRERDTLETVDSSVLSRTFSINTFGPLLLTQALLPNVLKSKQPRLGFMSSRVGSIADNSTGGSYAYRASKAALNSVCKSLAVELQHKGVIVVVMHPGYTKTGIDPAVHNMAEAVEPREAASKLWDVLMSKGISETGKFWHREGYELPW
ncbi:hypothetical protein BDY21DRAFT_164696 [Lineolata rhizophorae]|uniref:Uncharacterized protein n=1 Tax=Lineolata rhizophorae TaxID=578093 RepID=A0A6A6P971_9PEZI|nr:hypothetical protein BDY21DRAFT_164696 [Lineolata rhizophorae]